ncbi:hypothetical protein SRIMM317S_01595 [Streptomyces rimosus subsp. rimosus]
MFVAIRRTARGVILRPARSTVFARWKTPAHLVMGADTGRTGVPSDGTKSSSMPKGTGCTGRYALMTPSDTSAWRMMELKA